MKSTDAKKSESVKFSVEYFEDGKLASRWHYDYSITKNGPVLVEDFAKYKEYPPIPKKKAKKKGYEEVL